PLGHDAVRLERLRVVDLGARIADPARGVHVPGMREIDQSHSVLTMALSTASLRFVMCTDQARGLLERASLEGFQNSLVLGVRALGLSGQADHRDLVTTQGDFQLFVESRELAILGERRRETRAKLDARPRTRSPRAPPG